MQQSIRTWDNTCAMYEQMLYKICETNKDEIDRIFKLNESENLKYIKEADPFLISTGTGSAIKQIQKIDAIIGRMRLNPSERLSKENIAIMDAYDAARAQTRQRKKKGQNSSITLGSSYEEIRAVRSFLNNNKRDVELNASVALPGTDGLSLKKEENETPDGIVFAEEKITSFFGITEPLRESGIVESAIRKARKKLLASLFGKEVKYVDNILEGIIWIAIKEYNMNAFCSAEADGIKIKPRYFLPMACGKERDEIVWPVMFYTGLSKWRSGIMDEDDRTKESLAIIRKAVDRVLYAQIMFLLISRVFDARDRLAKPDVDFDLKKYIKEQKDTGFIYKSLSDLDYKAVMTSCIFASMVELEREERKRVLLKEMTSVQTMDPETLIEERESFKKKLDEKDGEIERLKEQLKEEREKIRGYARDKFNKDKADASIDSLNKSNLLLERKLKEKEQEIEMLREQLEDSAETIENDTAQVTACADEAHKMQEADTESRYLFLCSHEVCARKLGEYFKNSQTSEDYTLVPGNASAFKAVICITQSVPHGLYYKAKDICRNAGVPFINCNTVNVDTIKRLLVSQGFVKN